MKILLVTSIIIMPMLMCYLQQIRPKVKMLFNLVAVISTIIFGSIAATSIYQIIVDDAVFMTTIHAIFLKPIFLITGAYLGLFVIYKLMLLTLDER